MNSKIAPSELIREDFDRLIKKERLLTSERIEELIFIQSIEGRAHNGAGAFRKVCYVNTTIDDVVKALGRNPDTVRRERQNIIDSIYTYVKLAVEGRAPERLVDERGEPLLDVQMFKEITVTPVDVLRGLYYGGLRDDVETRIRTEARYNAVIGYGQCYLVDIDVMEDMGLDAEVLAHQPHGERLESFREQELILTGDVPKRLIDEGKVKYLYIRHKMGHGQSDDAGLIVGGLLYNTGTALGVFLSDAIDTFEKYSLFYRDQDVMLARYIEKEYGGLDIGIDRVEEMTYMSSIEEGTEEFVPDSSLRYLLSVDRDSGISVLETHLSFVQGKPYLPVPVSYKRVMVTPFYRYLTARINSISLRESERRPADAAMPRGDISISELANGNFIEVDTSEDVKNVIRKVREANPEYVVIKEGTRVTGIVTPRDFIRFLM